MGILNWALQTLGWILLTTGACYMAFQAGRRKECGLWEAWYEQQQNIDQVAERQRREMRSVSLSTVQFRRD